MSLNNHHVYQSRVNTSNPFLDDRDTFYNGNNAHIPGHGPGGWLGKSSGNVTQGRDPRTSTPSWSNTTEHNGFGFGSRMPPPPPPPPPPYPFTSAETRSGAWTSEGGGGFSHEPRFGEWSKEQTPVLEQLNNNLKDFYTIPLSRLNVPENPLTYSVNESNEKSTSFVAIIDATNLDSSAVQTAFNIAHKNPNYIRIVVIGYNANVPLSIIDSVSSRVHVFLSKALNGDSLNDNLKQLNRRFIESAVGYFQFHNVTIFSNCDSFQYQENSRISVIPVQPSPWTSKENESKGLFNEERSSNDDTLGRFLRAMMQVREKVNEIQSRKQREAQENDASLDTATECSDGQAEPPSAKVDVFSVPEKRDPSSKKFSVSSEEEGQQSGRGETKEESVPFRKFLFGSDPSHVNRSFWSDTQSSTDSSTQGRGSNKRPLDRSCEGSLSDNSRTGENGEKCDASQTSADTCSETEEDPGDVEDRETDLKNIKRGAKKRLMNDGCEAVDPVLKRKRQQICSMRFDGCFEIKIYD